MTENLAGRGEGLTGLVARLRDIGDRLRTTNIVRGREIHQICDDFTRALEAAAPAGTPDVHWAIKADCARCCESYPQRHDRPDYIPNFGNVEAGDWTHPCTLEHDWRYCQAARIHEALFAAALATPSPQAPADCFFCRNAHVMGHPCTCICHTRGLDYLPEAPEVKHMPAATQEQPAGSGDCIHVHLTKQVGPMDGGAESKRYACQCGENFTVEVQRTEVQFGSPRKVGEDGALKADDYRLVPVRLIQRFGANVPGNESDTRWTVCLPNGEYTHLFPEYLLARPSSVPVGEQKQEEGV